MTDRQFEIIYYWLKVIAQISTVNAGLLLWIGIAAWAIWLSRKSNT